MHEQTSPGTSAHRLRHARAADLRHLAAIEDSGVQQFRDLFGEEIEPVLLSPAISGASRADQPGFLLVAGDPPVGFAHVLDLDGHAHLEQVSVRPEAQHRGIGARLVRGAMAEARARGYRSMSLCTYRDVPWNGPFYASLGFVEVERLEPYQERLRDHERRLGLDRNGVRVVMSVALEPRLPAGELASPP
jgi:ribosomal protein S18 acetylase RimI-like enzyme